MKKLLLVIKSILVISLLIACSSSKNKKSTSEKPAKDKIEDTTPRAVIHTAPEQAKIDSIKSAKEKLRKKK